MVRGGKTYSLLGQLASLDRYALRLHRRLRLWKSDMNVGKKNTSVKIIHGAVQLNASPS